MSSQPGYRELAANRLSNELVTLILEHLYADHDRIIAIDRRQFLSVESFDVPSSSGGSVKDVTRFRLTSRRFAELGAQCLFNRVTVRLSRDGLARLEQFASWPSLTKHVRKFSYLMPAFYMHGLTPSNSLLRQLATDLGCSNVQRLMTKITEQRQLVDAGEDLRVFTQAFSTFTSLQHIQLLRVQDDDDNQIIQALRRHDYIDGRSTLDWAPACSHAARTICTALIAARNTQCSRFSSPMMDSQGLEPLGALQANDLAVLAERLTCLTLHFDDAAQLNERISRLSGLFQAVFTAAKNMQAVHVGFPAHAPLDLPLATVFHNVTWNRLVALGIQGWKLDADEILELALRHKDRLRGLRLRDALLKEDSSWRDVLVALRDHMQALQWISLRRIGYAAHFDSGLGRLGVEISDDLISDTDSEADVVSNSEDESSLFSSDEEGAEPDSDLERSLVANDFDFPPFSEAPSTRHSAGLASDDILEDDGAFISNTKRKTWERWVVARSI